MHPQYWLASARLGSTTPEHEKLIPQSRGTLSARSLIHTLEYDRGLWLFPEAEIQFNIQKPPSGVKARAGDGVEANGDRR